MGSRYNLDSERLSKLKKLKVSARKDGSVKMSSKQMLELSILKAQEDISLAPMSRKSMLKSRNYLIELIKTNSATRADTARLMILEERLSI